jgi:hypothetical protein
MLVILALVASMVMAVPALGAPPTVTFTGNVENDFPTGPGILTFVDPGGRDVLLNSPQTQVEAAVGISKTCVSHITQPPTSCT